MADPAPDYGPLRTRLEQERQQWTRRMEAIRRDRRRESQPLERDSDEQAIQLENDETLDALDGAGRRELEAIDAALSRLDAGTYGTCARCGDPIAYARLEALPTAATCADCAAAAR